MTENIAHTCFTLLCEFLLCHELNQLYVYSYRLPFEPPSHASVPPLYIITGPQTELPLLHTSFPLAICFTHGSVYMSIPISQFISSCPSTLVYTSVLYILRLSSCPANRCICTTFLDSTYVLIYIFFSFWLTSLCMTVSRSIHSSGKDPMSLYLRILNLVICVSPNVNLEYQTLRNTDTTLWSHIQMQTQTEVLEKFFNPCGWYISPVTRASVPFSRVFLHVPLEAICIFQ